MYSKFLAMIVLAVCSHSIVTAKQLPVDQVIPGSSKCFASYQKKYQSLSGNRAFAYAINPTTGAQRCGWSSGKDSTEQARKRALIGCAKRKIGVACQVVDVNGQWHASSDNFIALIPPDPKRLNTNEKQKIMDAASPLLRGGCYRSLKKYLDSDGHKAFAYAVDATGRYACTRVRRKGSAEIAVYRALASCKKNLKKKGKKAPDSQCEIYARDNQVVRTAADYGFDELPTIDQLSDVDYGQRLSQASQVLSRRCLSKFKRYLRARSFKVFYFAMDETGVSACEGRTLFLERAAAEKIARESCENSATLVKTPCRLFARGNQILSKPEDFPLAKGIKGFKTALAQGMLGRVRAYVALGADINTQSGGPSVTPVLLAAAMGDEEAYREFIRAGGDPNARLGNGGNLLSGAIVGGNLAIVRDALARGVSPNVRGGQGYTALHYALKVKNPYILQLLIAAGGDVTITNDAGDSAQSLLASLKMDMAQLNAQFNINEAAKNNDITGLQEILASTDRATRKDALSGALSMVTRLTKETYHFLLSQGGDANETDRNGESVLMLAAQFGKSELVKLLLANGANKSQTDGNGRVAADYARNESVKALLR